MIDASGVASPTNCSGLLIDSSGPVSGLARAKSAAIVPSELYSAPIPHGMSGPTMRFASSAPMMPSCATSAPIVGWPTGRVMNAMRVA